MARRTQISKEVILETAFQMLLKDGYGTINITSLAKELGCSTQPIAWHFGSMEGLRRELLGYCVYFIGKMFRVTKKESVTEMLEAVAEGYIRLAFDYPNLYRYFYMSDREGKEMHDMSEALRSENYTEVVGMLQKEYGVSAKTAERHVKNLQFYVHG